MSEDFKAIAIIGRANDSRVLDPMRAISSYLTKSGIRVVADASYAAELGASGVPESELAQGVDLMIAVGGDGTMLYAADIARDHELPLLGVNRGRLGFLADVSPDVMLNSLAQVLAGDYTRESRLLLHAEIQNANGETSQAIALNDVVLQRTETGRMVDFETRIAGQYVNTHSGDGLIVATPTGSTAYSLSCGGPIMEPGLDTIALVPICPHTLSDRPIVISSGNRVEIVVLERDDIKAAVIVDGRAFGELLPGDRLSIIESAKRITLIHPPGHDYYEILRSKLHWGRDSRVRTSASPGE